MNRDNPIFKMPVRTMTFQNALKAHELLCPNCNVELKKQIVDDDEHNYFGCEKCNCVYALPKDFPKGFESSWGKKEK